MTVLRSASIRQKDQSDTAWTQDSVDLRYETDGFSEVLKDVAGDDKVLALVRDRGKAVGVEVGDHIRLFEFALHLREQHSTFGRSPAIDIVDLRAGQGEHEGVVARPEFDPGSDKMPREQLPW